MTLMPTPRWEPWYAPPAPGVGYAGGGSLGNSFRIHGDGKNWGALCVRAAFARIGTHGSR